ncbi:MAG: NUDIX hydrolase [Desulfurococcales archaeon]|nr:NUDIX hydrolase [Desulfurococcales archaeon]
MRPEVAVGAIVLRNDEILLVKRRFNPSAGFWAIPGGHVEEGEFLEEAVRRELLEETGLKALKLRPYAVTEYIGTQGESVKYHYVIIDFLVDDFEGSVRMNEESTDIGFFRLKEALRMNLAISTRKAIHSLLGINARKYEVVVIGSRVELSRYDAEVKRLLELESAKLGGLD